MLRRTVGSIAALVFIVPVVFVLCTLWLLASLPCLWLERVKTERQIRGAMMAEMPGERQVRLRKMVTGYRTVKILSAIAFGLGIFGILHQGIAMGGWWCWEQFWHHEPLIAMCFVCSVSLLVGEYAANKNHVNG